MSFGTQKQVNNWSVIIAVQWNALSQINQNRKTPKCVIQFQFVLSIGKCKLVPHHFWRWHRLKFASGKIIVPWLDYLQFEREREREREKEEIEWNRESCILGKTQVLNCRMLLLYWIHLASLKLNVRKPTKIFFKMKFKMFFRQILFR